MTTAAWIGRLAPWLLAVLAAPLFFRSLEQGNLLYKLPLRFTSASLPEPGSSEPLLTGETTAEPMRDGVHFLSFRLKGSNASVTSLIIDGRPVDLASLEKQPWTGGISYRLPAGVVHRGTRRISATVSGLAGEPVRNRQGKPILFTATLRNFQSQMLDGYLIPRPVSEEATHSIVGSAWSTLLFAVGAWLMVQMTGVLPNRLSAALAALVLLAHLSVPAAIAFSWLGPDRWVYTPRALLQWIGLFTWLPAGGLLVAVLMSRRLFLASLQSVVRTIDETVDHFWFYFRDLFEHGSQVRYVRESLLLVLLLAIPDLVFLARGQSYMSHDTLTSNLPLKGLAMDQLREGQVPLWTSKLGCGSPLLADTIALPFDWRNIWYLVASAPAAYWLALFSGRAAGAIVCLFYFRHHHRFRFSAAMTATLTYFCGTLFFEECRLHSTCVILDGVPLVMWLTERLLARPSLGRSLALSAGWALLFFMGSIAYLVYLPVLCGAWAVFLWFFTGNASRDGDEEAPTRLTVPSWARVRHLLTFSIAYVAAILWSGVLCGVTLLPFVELVGQSNRGGEYPVDPFAFRSVWFGLFGAHAPNWAVPGFSFFFYVGVAALPLLMASLTRRETPHLRMLPWISAVTLAGLILTTSPLKPVLVRYFPVFATVAFFRLSFFWGWQAALLVGYAVHRGTWQVPAWCRRVTLGLFSLQVAPLLLIPVLAGWLTVLHFEDAETRDKLWDLIAPFVATNFLLFIALRTVGLWPMARLSLASTPAQRPGWAVDRATLVLAVELILATIVLRPKHDLSRGQYPVTPELTWLQERADPNFRVMQVLPYDPKIPDEDADPDRERRSTWSAITATVAKDVQSIVRLFTRPTLRASNEGRYSLYLDAQGYMGLFTANVYESLIPDWFSRFYLDFGDIDYRKDWFSRATNAVMITSRHDSSLMDAVGVKYLLCEQSLPLSGNYALRLRGENYNVYERMNPLPRATVVPRAEWHPNNQVHERLAAMGKERGSSVPLREMVLLSTDGRVGARQDEFPPQAVATTQASAKHGSARIASDQDGTVSVSVAAPEGGWLVLSDTHFPGWTATVNDTPTPIALANGFARAVPVPAGDSTVTFRYQPASYRRGAWLTLVGLGLTGLYAVGAMLLKRRTVGGPFIVAALPARRAA